MTTQQEQTHPPGEQQQQQPAVGSTSFCWKFLLGIWGVLVSILDELVRIVDSVVPAVFGQYHDVDGPIKKRREHFVLFIALAIILAAVSALVWIAVYLRDVEVIELLCDSHPCKSLVSTALYVPALFTHVIGQMRIEGQGKWLASTFVPVYLIDAVAGLIDAVAGVLPDPESVEMVFIGGAWKCFVGQLLVVFVPAAVVYYRNVFLVPLVVVPLVVLSALVLLLKYSLFWFCCLVVFGVVTVGAASIDWDSVVKGWDDKISSKYMTSRDVKLGVAIALSFLLLVWKSCVCWLSVSFSIVFITVFVFICVKGLDKFLETSRLSCFLSRKDTASSGDDAANG